MEGKISSGQLMVNGALRIIFYSGPRFLSLSPTQGKQMTLTSVFLLDENRLSRTKD